MKVTSKKSFGIILFTSLATLILVSSFFALSAMAQNTKPNVNYGTSTPQDSDFDGLTNQAEITIYHTNPNKADTDGDGILDGAEILLGSDPLDPNSPIVGGLSSVASAAASPATQALPWVWYIIRASGIAAYVLLFFILVLGIGIYTRLAYLFFKSEDALAIHKYVSIAAWFIIVAHVVLLLFDPFLKFNILEVLVPFISHFKSAYVSFGIFGFYLIIVAMISSIFFKEKYQRLWRLLHYLTYPMFFLLFLHGVLTGTDTQTPLMQIIYWSTGIIASIAVLYRIIYPSLIPVYRCVIKHIHKPSNDTVVIELARKDGQKMFAFKSGQYASIALYDKNGRPGGKHHFSISSAPDENDTIRLGIRLLGDFTQTVAKMKAGDELAVYGPSGDFIFEEREMKDIVFLAGGIGITPFMSAFRHAVINNLSNKLTLIYSNRTVESTIFAEEMRMLSERNPNFKPFLVVTNEPNPPAGFETGRVDKEKLSKLLENKFQGRYFFLCGPAPFMDAMTKNLIELGVKPEFIRKESFTT